MGDLKKRFRIEGKELDLSEINLLKSSNYEPLKLFLEKYLDSTPTYLTHTSGSTGAPKRIKLSKNDMRASALKTLSFLGIKEGDKALLCISPEYIGGIMMLVRWVEGGLDLYIKTPDSSPLEGVEEVIDLAAMVPLQLMNSVSSLDKVKSVIVGGGAINSDLERSTNWNAYPANVYHSYGMTETVSHVALRNVSKGQEAFKALKGVSFSLDSRNCLIINSKEIGVENLVTNDVVDLKSETSFVWKGRYDNVVNSGGIKFYPEEIEKKINKEKFNFFLSGVEDKKLGQKLIMVVEGSKIELDNLVNEAISSLGKYEKPRSILYVSQFQYTTSSKIQRKETLRNALLLNK